MDFDFNKYFNEEIIEKALTYVEENKIKEFFNLFYWAECTDTHILIWPQTDKGIKMPNMWFNLSTWKEDFNDYIKLTEFDMNIEARNLMHDERYSLTFTFSDIKEEVENFYKKCHYILKLANGEHITNDTDNVTENDYNDFNIMVLLFDKGHYNHKDLEEKNDIEKYNIAIEDKRQCWVYTAKEYMEIVNSFRPIEKYVWTYIVMIPTENVLK